MSVARSPCPCLRMAALFAVLCCSLPATPGSATEKAPQTTTEPTVIKSMAIIWPNIHLMEQAYTSRHALAYQKRRARLSVQLIEEYATRFSDLAQIVEPLPHQQDGDAPPVFCHRDAFLALGALLQRSGHYRRKFESVRPIEKVLSGNHPLCESDDYKNADTILFVELQGSEGAIEGQMTDFFMSAALTAATMGNAIIVSNNYQTSELSLHTVLINPRTHKILVDSEETSSLYVTQKNIARLAIETLRCIVKSSGKEAGYGGSSCRAYNPYRFHRLEN